jgi:hypothetical protein
MVQELEGRGRGGEEELVSLGKEGDFDSSSPPSSSSSSSAAAAG